MWIVDFKNTSKFVTEVLEVVCEGVVGKRLVDAGDY